MLCCGGIWVIEVFWARGFLFAGPGLGYIVGGGVEVMDERLERETEGLRRSWEQHGRGVLRDYLVEDVEDPRINVQSILTRHFLVEGLFGDGFSELMEHELRFALVMNWVSRLLKEGVGGRRLQLLLDVLVGGGEEPDGPVVPRHVSETFSRLSFPNYICDLLGSAPAEMREGKVPDYALSLFQGIWREMLEEERHEGVSVVEPACGSANDYRYIDAYGISRFLEYKGFDLSAKNVANAREMFGEGRFEVGNVLEIEAGDGAYDYCFVHDLFEHLSLEAMEVAVGEVCRVTRRGICAGFFNMYEGGEHVEKVVGEYHWNRLSAARTREMFERPGWGVEVIGIDAFLKSRFGFEDTHNKGAYTFLVKREDEL